MRVLEKEKPRTKCSRFWRHLNRMNRAYDPARLLSRGTGGAVKDERRSLLQVSHLIDGEVAGQVAVSMHLCRKVVGLFLNGRYSVGAGGKTQRWLILARDLDQRVSELRGVTALLAVHAVPGCDGLPG